MPQDILPGPLDDVVIDLPDATIVHADDIDDTIASLTVTAPDDFLDLDGGTLDLSGSGAPGTFQVPGTVDFSNNQYGNVDLNGGVLANANVTPDTAIGVLGDLTPALAAEEEGTIDGGVLNGSIEVNDGGYATLNLIGGWVNNGTITVNSSNLNLGDNSDTEAMPWRRQRCLGQQRRHLDQQLRCRFGRFADLRPQPEQPHHAQPEHRHSLLERRPGQYGPDPHL